MFKKIFILASLLFFIVCADSFALRIPSEDSGVKYFYIFGPEGNPFFGAYTGEMSLFIDVPATVNKEVIIKIIDPDTCGKLDDIYKECNTEIEFSIYGKEFLERKSFGEGETDIPSYQFGPYPLDKGMLVEGKYRFKIVAKPIKGDDANLFAFQISPEEAEVFTYGLAFRLAEEEGRQMYFYPTVPAKTGHIIMRNYDIDPDGGVGYLYVDNRRYKIKDSGSGVWSETKVALTNVQSQSLKYMVVKKTQKHGNAVISALDDKGNLVPIYFKPMQLAYVSTEKETPTSPAPKKRPIPETKKERPPREKPQVVKKVTPVVKKPKYVPETQTKIPPRCDTFIFDATESYDPNKRPLKFNWDFGDGQTSDQAVVTHTYKKPGLYTVTLTVVNNTELECNKDTKTETVRVNFPPQPVFSAPDAACINKEIVFDASASSDAEGEKLSYLWDFGDGTTSPESRTRHIYSKSGIYKVTLTVKDDSGTPCDTSQISRTIRINSAPQVKAVGDINICEANPDKPLEVTFDASGCWDADNDNLTYLWDFGDGEKQEGQVVTHTYEKGGNYIARLTVTDDSGSECNSATTTFAVNLNRAPKASAGEDKDICVTDEVTLDASSSYDKDKNLLKYTWDFGDGTEKEGLRVSHRYAKGGKYNVVLTVDDGRQTPCSKSSDNLVVVANTGPYASLNAPNIACVGEQVSFDASGSYDLDSDTLTYSWNFGDGKELAKVGPAVVHRYEKGGKYKVTVTLDDGKKSPCSKAIAQTEIKINTPPQAISGPNLVCCVGDIARFDGSRSLDADGDELTYIWDFGDGTAARGAKVTHEYKKSGTYTVTLMVKDNSGSKCDSATAKFVAEVSESPVSVIKVKPKQP
ncbi:MAG: PKD domain-containing protein [Candidatus Omnitrophica bacterium]|nr:PKD domain-containing protein [Candidatus Omnitrophota bacterium]